MNVNLYKLIEKKFRQNIEDETTLNLALDVLNQRENLTQENQKYKETINKAKKWVKNRINHCTIEANSTTTDTMCRITIVGLNNLLDILKEVEDKWVKMN